jgi:hypothetical protein
MDQLLSYLPPGDAQKVLEAYQAYEALPWFAKHVIAMAAIGAVCFGALLAFQELRTDWRKRRFRRGLKFYLYGPRETLEQAAAIPELSGLLRVLWTGS